MYSSPGGAAGASIAPPGLTAKLILTRFQGLTPLATNYRPSGASDGYAVTSRKTDIPANDVTKRELSPEGTPVISQGRKPLEYIISSHVFEPRRDGRRFCRPSGAFDEMGFGRGSRG